MKVLKQKKAVASLVCPDGTYQGVVSGYELRWSAEVGPGLTTEFTARRHFGIRGTMAVEITTANGIPTTVKHKNRIV